MTPASYFLDHPHSHKVFCGNANKGIAPIKNSRSSQQYCAPCKTRIAHEDLNMSNSNNCPSVRPDRGSRKLSVWFDFDPTSAKSVRRELVEERRTSRKSPDDALFHSKYKCPICPREPFYRNEPRAKTDKKLCGCVEAGDEKDEKFLDEKLRSSFAVVEERAAGRSGHPIFKNPMIPGYAGHVPLKAKQFGKGYESTTIMGIAEFEEAIKRPRKSLKSQLNNNSNQHNNCPYESNACNNTIMTKMTQQCKTQLLNPYKMANNDPNKYFIPGYGGHVPMTLNRTEPFAVMTNKALNEFTDYQKATFPQPKHTNVRPVCKPESLSQLPANECSRKKGCR